MEKKIADSFVLIDDEDGHLRLDKYGEGMYLVHADIHKWSPRKYKEYLSRWIFIAETFYEMGMDEIRTVVPDHYESVHKFVNMFGFVPHMHAEFINETTGESFPATIYTFNVPEFIGEAP